MFYVTDKKIVNKKTLLQVLDTSDGVSEWYSYEEIVRVIQKSNIVVFGVKPLHVYQPSSGVFNKHIASILLSGFTRYLFRIPYKDDLNSLGFATETLPSEEYGFDDFEYNGVVCSGFLSEDMCTAYFNIQVKSIDKIESIDLYNSLLGDDGIVHLKVDTEVILGISKRFDFEEFKAIRQVISEVKSKYRHE